MKKIIAIVALALASATVVAVAATQPAQAQESLENDLLRQQIANAQKELAEFQRQHGLAVSKPLPPIVIPAVPIYKMPPDPYAPPTFVAPIQLKERCVTLITGKTCWKGM